MAEDSGAFKTNPANSRPISAFSRDREAPLPRSITGPGNVFGQFARHSCLRFLTSAGKPLRYSEIGLIRGALAGSAALRTRPIRWSPRSQCSKAFAEPLRRRNSPLNAPRLPFSVHRRRIVSVDTGLRAGCCLLYTSDAA